MDSIQCAVVLAKLERFDWEVERRIAIGRRYGEGLRKLGPGIRVLTVRPDRTSVHAQYTICAADRDGLQTRLKAEGVPTAVHYPLGLHQQPAYAAAHVGESYPISERLAREVISLPMHADLDDASQDRLVEALRRSLPARVAT
jgi:UDP-2-acetamido-2-deoxy-ribo-hexuluronate aminotransferase